MAREYEFNLGNLTRPITTNSEEAQRWFDRGLTWAYGFNHEEAVACFERAIEADRGCAMAHWGVAYASGPNYNKTWDAFDDAEAAASLSKAHAAAVRAIALSKGCTSAEDDLIAAIALRFPQSTMDPAWERWEDNYAEAMRGVYQRNPDDSDIEALFADALMTRTPWALWDLKSGGVPEGAHTLEAKQVLEQSLQRMELRGEVGNPGVYHMYIHLMEMSHEPEKALPACDYLRGLVPDAGHLQHMPTHIDVMCGDYSRVVSCNRDAMRADRRFLEKEGALNFYSLYRSHNTHFRVYGAMFLGRRREALATADELVSTLPEELLRIESPPMADWLEAFVPIRQHVLIRFGMWEEVLDQVFPEDRDLYAATVATMRYARAVSLASLQRTDEAEREAVAFAAAKLNVPESRYLFNNSCLDILAVAEMMMQGEIAYRRGEIDLAFQLLREAIELDDNLLYDEPWAWMQPVRHALGALLLEQNRVEEAYDVYCSDLGYNDKLPRACQHPNNIWSLSGYLECVEKLGKTDLIPLARQKFALAAGRADVPVRSSCFCRLSAL